ncbi:MAG: DUF3794 domain-containing protein [Clostridia bacterium]|nr:DUF3794 domain-containing protein [Clostridia bacterium]
MFDFEKFSSARFYTAPTVEKVIEFSPEGIDVENILKVLSLSVDAKCESAEAYEGYAEIGGRANFKLVYIDKENTPRGVDYNADFSARVDGEFESGDYLSCRLNVLDAEVSAKDSLTLSCVLEITVRSTKREEIEVLLAADDCYKKTKEMEMPTFIASKSTTSQFFDDVNVGGEIDSVLGVNAVAIVKEATAGDGVATVRSLVSANVVFSKDGEIVAERFEIPLEDELNVEGLEEGDKLVASANVKNAKIVLQGVTGDNILRIEGEINLKIEAYRCTKIEVVDDVFMLSNETLITRRKMASECLESISGLDESVSGIAILGDNRPPAQSVVCLPYARCYETKTAAQDGRIILEGVVNTDIVYTDENGYNSVRAEIPFSLDLGEADEGAKYAAQCTARRASATIRREREFEISVDLFVRLAKFVECENEYVESIEIGEERPKNDSALSMYIAGEGEELLDVCKALYAMPEDILAQNPDLTFPLKEGEQVVYFRRIG